MTELSDMLNASMNTAQMVSKSKSLSDIFDEEPVSLTRFVQEKNFLDNPALSDEQYRAVQHIERVYYADLYPMMGEYMDPYWKEPVRMTNLVTLEWGKGSGKDHICRIASLRVAYLLLCLKSPQQYYGIPDQDSIHLLNVAASALQASRAFFKPLTQALGRGWFLDHSEPKVISVTYDKHIEAISGNSETETQEGLNLMLGVADEVDAFKSRATAASRGGRELQNTVEGLLDMLRTSASTRFPETYKNVRISYPRYKGSAIQQLSKAGRKDMEENGDKSRHYVSGPLATWDVNPRISGKEVFAEDYKSDPIMAAAKYECRPAFAISPYFRNEQAVDDSMIQMEPPITISGYRLDGRNWIPIYEFSNDFVPIVGAAYAMHGDLAVNGDNAGLAMSHVVKFEEYETTVVAEDGEHISFSEQRPIVKVDFVLNFSADASTQPPREVQIRWARNLAFELIRKGFSVQRFTFDGFQSTDSIQILFSKGIESERVSTDMTIEPYRNLRDMMSEGRVRIPKNEKLKVELLSLNKLPNGKLDHPPHGTKDMADAVACSVMGSVLLGGAEDDSGQRAEYAPAVFVSGGGIEAPVGLSTEHMYWHNPPSTVLNADY